MKRQPLSDLPKVTVPDLARMKALEERIAMATAYDATFAHLVDLAGVDMILVGDSLGNVVLKRLVSLPGVRDMQSSIALKTVKRAGKLPLEHAHVNR